MASFDELNIIMGRKCTMSCDHCCMNSSPQYSDSITDEEIEVITRDINKFKPNSINFVGGEPTLFIDKINRLLSKLIHKPQICITTNGWFANSLSGIDRVLSKIKILDTVIVSVDSFHKNERSFNRIINIQKWAKASNKTFSARVCISEPRQIEYALDLKADLGIEVIIEKVQPVGRAKITNSQYKYESFDKRVLNRKCPSSRSLTYYPRIGYSTCCAGLPFEKVYSFLAFNSVIALFNSRCTQEINSKSFHERLLNTSISEKDLTPVDSHECAVCVRILNSTCEYNMVMK